MQESDGLRSCLPVPFLAKGYASVGHCDVLDNSFLSRNQCLGLGIWDLERDENSSSEHAYYDIRVTDIRRKGAVP